MQKKNIKFYITFLSLALSSNLCSADSAISGNPLASKYIVLSKQNGNWKVIAVSDNKTQWLYGQEILTYPSLNPSFENDGSYKYLNVYYSYGKGGMNAGRNTANNDVYECKVGGDKTAYTPCTSTLSSFIDTDMFGISGNSRYSLDNKRLTELRAAIQDDPILKELDEARSACLMKHKAVAEDYASRVKIEPVYVDMSGFYDSSITTKVSSSFDNADCMIEDTTKIRHKMKVSFYRNNAPLLNPRGDKYNVSIDSNEFIFNQIEPAPTLRPKVTIQSMNIEGLAVNRDFTDGELNIWAKRIHTKDGVDATLSMVVSNKSKEFMRIRELAIHLKDIVISSGDIDISIPPRASTALDAYSIKARGTSQLKDYLNQRINKDNINEKYFFAISAKYERGSVTKTMHDEKQVPMKALF